MGPKFIALVGLTGLVAACSLIVESGAEQCSTDSDCAGRGLLGAVCSPDRTCVTTSPAPAEAGTSDAPSVVRPADAAEDAPTVDAGECSTNQECITKAGGSAAICRKDTKSCVTLLNADCGTVYSSSIDGSELSGADAVKDDATVVIGSIGSLLSAANGGKAKARLQAVELAIAEIMTSAGGLPPVAGTTTRRPIAVLGCTDTDAPLTGDAGAPAVSAVVRSARHMVEVGVPGVVGAGNTSLTIALVAELAKKGVFVIAPSATADTISTQDDDNLLWRTAPKDSLQSILLANRLQSYAPDNGSKKVAVISKSDSYGTGLYTSTISKVTRGGVAITDSANAAFFQTKVYTTASPAEVGLIVPDVLGFKPDVVLVIGTAEAIGTSTMNSGFITAIEQGWSSTGVAQRPQYVVSDGLKSQALTDAVGADEVSGATGLRARVVGTAPGRPNATTTAFRLRFEPKYTNANSAAFGTAGAYDAAYVILYALVASGKPVPVGQDIVAGVSKLLGGASLIDVGPTGVTEAFQKLTAGSAIDLNGASSPLTFDLKVGESPADIEVWCLPPKPGVLLPTFTTTPLFYNAATQAVAGSYSCP